MGIRVSSNTSTAYTALVRARASVAVVDPVAGVVCVVPAAEIKYVELAVNAHLDTTGKFRYVMDISIELVEELNIAFTKARSDAFGLSDITTRAISPKYSDSVSPLSDQPVFAVDKALTDESPLDDALAYSFDKPLVDATPELADALARSFDKSLADATPGMDDSASSTVTKSLIDSVTIQDVLERYIVALREFSESVDATDNSSWEFTAGTEAEQIGVGDTFAPVFAKAVSDAFSMNDSSEAGDGSTYSFAKFINNVVFSGDNLASAVTKPLSDSFDSLDSGLVVSQSYCDITYFAEDYVGASAIF